MVLDENLKVVYVNRSWKEDTGYSLDEIEDAVGFEVLYPDDIEKVAGHLHRVLNGESLRNIEYRRVIKSGETRWMEGNADPIQWPGAKRAIVNVSHDITDRKQAEEALRESEERMKLALEGTDQGLWDWDIVTGAVTFDDNWPRVLGYTPGEMEFDFAWWERSIHPDSAPIFEAALNAYLEGREKHFEFEYQIIDKLGEWRWIWARGICVAYGKQGEPLRVIGTHRDITERKLAEQAIEKLSAVVEAMVDGVTITGLNGRIVYMNSAAAKQTGRKQGELVGRTPLKFIAEKDHKKFIAQGRDFLSGKSLHGMEYSVVHKDGKEIPLSVRFSALHDAEGKPGEIITVSRDITERKRAEEALQRERDNLHNILGAMEDGVYIANQQYDIQYVNPVLEREFGSPEGRKCYEYFHDRNEVCPWCKSSDVFEGRTVQWEWYSFKNGKTYDLIDTPLRNPDGSISKLEIFRDITERKRAEEERRKLDAQIQHAQKFESMGVLAGGVAHDFNNLLTSILGNASLARKELSPASPAFESLEEIETASQRAAELCRQMLAYAGKGKFIIEPVGLNELVEEMAHLLEVSISKKVVLKYDFADNLPAIEADATQIRQVIMNLITNASEALGEESGTIKITTGTKKCTREFLRGIYLGKELPEGEYLCLEVADTGCGMDEETLAKMFDPFFTTKFTGRGLGLAAALGIARGHKGAIIVSSKPGRGTTFKIFFPATDRPAKPAEKEPAEVEQGWIGSGTILLVDDERGIRRLGKRILEDFGFDVLVAANGREAVRVFQKHKNEIVLVLLDLTMPKMSGDEAFQEIRQIKSDACVILSSGYMEEDAVVRFAGRGLAGFLQKPYNSRVLEKKIRGVLGD